METVKLFFEILVVIATLGICIGIAKIVWGAYKKFFGKTETTVDGKIVTKETPTIPVLNIDNPISKKGKHANIGYVRKLMDPFLSGRTKENTPAIAVYIDCPGGSPAQSFQIAEYLRTEADKLGVPLLVFAGDMIASGGYYIAAVADEINILNNTMIGSVGVRSGGFGFVDLLSKIGIESRMKHSTRANKKLSGSPFVKETKESVESTIKILDAVHEDFASFVKKHRKGKLADYFRYDTGEVWCGQEAIDLGLADNIGSMYSVLSKRYPGIKTKNLETTKSKLENLIGASLSVMIENLGITLNHNKIEAI